MELTKIYAGCSKCLYIDTCNHKRMEAHGYLIPAAADVSMSAAMPVGAPAMRDLSTATINLGESGEVDVLRENLKKELEKQFHIGLDYGA